MLFVVGLGNPGTKYDGTRHNVGFEVVSELARRHGFPRAHSHGQALVSCGCIEAQEVMLVEPTTYMNKSGDSVAALVGCFEEEVAQLIVIHDDLDFEPGEVRIKIGGGHGGHNGLRSIMSQVERDFVRVRVGIGKPEGDGADWVLSRFVALERVEIDGAIKKAATAVEMVIGQGVQKAMNQFNRRRDKEEDADGKGEEGEEKNGEE
ncbi:MAG: aminoacyl-tRNA hydrolase [Deltaproteobacteria bacterium RIFOXYA12_FULL_58_15]|nr:MAG: aminoacyl-tRNA hydrolase [Deltaproteobacteria bacterium RIFOXYA12_FULL_58_15]OGR09647.1 MAG: aminoacyl-tRNA hydrolase [Deltaproteobacteria bacterium RIFOXYB12_FULL_58_9]